ncbi:heterokaryon incompatibility protein-domain-containing protein [Podospora australis]|uniref:Heterokaryon incompatibility protein-domain-containing protein n=1 Tax=Podospora australis TaxID=1536484 RepID=A0AAN6WP76_9PEZI|nr:heterokaryon incompatibility protein-domain-containing protein [Podospora australis]
MSPRPPPNSRNCKACRGLQYDNFPHAEKPGVPRRWITSFAAVRRAASSGCETCHFLSAGAKWAWGETPEEIQKAELHYVPHLCGKESAVCDVDTHPCNLNGKFCHDLGINIRPGRRLFAWRRGPHGETNMHMHVPPLSRPNNAVADTIEFFTPQGSPQLHPAFGFAPDVPQSLDLATLVSAVRVWLYECDEHHEACRNPQPPPALPRRLIDITGTIRFIETEVIDLPRNTKYATLSHCWGEPHDATSLLKTLSTNLERHKVAIDWQELPQLFQDVIEIVRVLGCSFVWIDSLCIVQDDENDWRNQSVLMSDVYSGAYFNLAASALPNSSGRIFADRTCNLGDPRRREAHPKGSFKVNGISTHQESTILVRRTFDRQHFVMYGSSAGASTHDCEPLLTRAWVFQERLLSKRTIHIGTSEIMWECRCCYHCECGMIAPPFQRQERTPQSDTNPAAEVMAEDLPATRSNRSLLGDALKPKKVLFAEASSPKASRTEVFDFWMQAVEEYSGLHLSQESDRLVSLGSIARNIQEATGFTYLAGLWLEDSPRMLMWTGWGDFRPATLIAETFPPKDVPSWAWISRLPHSRYEFIHWDKLRWYPFVEGRILTSLEYRTGTGLYRAERHCR